MAIEETNGVNQKVDISIKSTLNNAEQTSNSGDNLEEEVKTDED